MDLKKQILEAYNYRHACKEFDSSKKISDEDFNFILETGRLSPSSFGFEPWRFLVIQDNKLREKLKLVSWGAQGQLPTASHFVILLSRTKEDMIFNSQYISNFMNDVQGLPSDVVEIKKGYYQNFQENDFKLLESERAIFDWACKQTYIALGNMMTTAALIKIDSCPMEGFDKEQVETILEQEGVLDKSKFNVACMVAFGYRKEDPRPKTRQNMDEIVQYI
ncbi:NAD(P)H-dependent oxidoreductase [Pelosinus sp. IPA-1]|uniref:NAD(P)H-dependent oxidoreductase n=1 Tax=Pelosinus sp. IPA-1 TaxID=3029569 RepID=UPI00243619C5|nr:NAD(P)H-dependent oxidoreductase [Pelosinus sp. IPA-1]GMA99045.1 NAD(P)H-dependent oxidoreductase [Pelosinus sp. IPA-1]